MSIRERFRWVATVMILASVAVCPLLSGCRPNGGSETLGPGLEECEENCCVTILPAEVARTLDTTSVESENAPAH